MIDRSRSADPEETQDDAVAPGVEETSGQRPARRPRPLASPRFLPAGDLAVVVEFGDAIDPAINAAVIALDAAIAANPPAGVIETVPTYRSLLVQYEPRDISFEDLVATLRDLLRASARRRRPSSRCWTVPVAYGGAFGEDLDEVARRCGMEPERVIEAHLAAEYQVYMIGFAPGFAYLGGLPQALHLPRRENPRPRIPEGSVIIGAQQAAIAATAIPSGWHLLGRTPARGFDLGRHDPFLFRPGDRIRFRRIDAAEFASLTLHARESQPVAVLED